ncbi:hypothetical protein M406DRAFT_330491 [Cryphonectria parasitica EP155]|uniref:Uncharacterized protein n=1 Tax=Cryphonectria parasitica (strain ATCC 38755 / EP155) TaxID=660469 RepID=A0A9P4Y0H6_CRYP1|nr:uncharacterized protein M406DRAFT_330491 [Cryphonectria parasitica EP155]KAF3764140.1 hypothetical protein M406DRAFT_330491 [Cryphonectria parasitica EP155]
MFTAVFLLLSHITLALSMPTYHLATRETKNNAVHDAHSYSKRAINLSSIKSTLAGGAAGLVILALVIGLGAASIAILGSIEWAEFRGKNKKEAQKGVAKEKEEFESDSDSDSIKEYKEKAVQQPRLEEAVTDEKPRMPSMPKRSRLSLKSFLPPMDFNSAWGSNPFKS